MAFLKAKPIVNLPLFIIPIFELHEGHSIIADFNLISAVNEVVICRKPSSRGAKLELFTFATFHLWAGKGCKCPTPQALIEAGCKA